MIELTGQVVLIDFGLATSQCSLEDKAVDLYVLERSFIATHPEHSLLVRNADDSNAPLLISVSSRSFLMHMPVALPRASRSFLG